MRRKPERLIPASSAVRAIAGPGPTTTGATQPRSRAVRRASRTVGSSPPAAATATGSGRASAARNNSSNPFRLMASPLFSGDLREPAQRRADDDRRVDPARLGGDPGDVSRNPVAPEMDDAVEL